VECEQTWNYSYRPTGKGIMILFLPEIVRLSGTNPVIGLKSEMRLKILNIIGIIFAILAFSIIVISVLNINLGLSTQN
jgi:hypothetical protein